MLVKSILVFKDFKMDRSHLHLVNLKNYIMHTAEISNWDIIDLEDAVIVLNIDKSCIFNYVFQKDPRNIFCEDTGKSVLAVAKSKGCSLSWPIETTEPKRELYSRIFHLGTPSLPKKAFFDLKNDPKVHHSHNMKGLEFIPVNNKEALQTFDLMTSVIFVHDFGISKTFFRGLDGCDFKNSILKIFLVTYDSYYIGCCSMFIDGDVAGFYTDGILPQYRNQGFGTAMLCKRISLSREYGCKFAIAHCMKASVNMYKRVGFEMIGAFPLYSSYPEDFSRV